MTSDHRPDTPSATDSAGTDLEESTTRRILRRLGQVLALPLIGLIRVYQLVISPLTPPTCRYYPSCSAYAVTSLQRFGPIKGTWLAARRLLRCHPWAPGGVDHVPPRVSAGGASSTRTTDADLHCEGPPTETPSLDTRSAERPTEPQG